MDLKILHNIYYKSQKTINKQSEKKNDSCYKYLLSYSA